MTPESIRDRIVDFVGGRDWVSFPEIGEFLAEDGIDVKGDISLEIAPNLVVWAGMSHEFADLMRDALKSNRIYPHPSSSLTHLIDGGMLTLPVAKRLPKNGYKKPHWMPTVFRTVPYKTT